MLTTPHRKPYFGNLYDENECYYTGDTWRFWIGPRVKDSDPKSAETMAEVQRVFQSANKIRECLDRHRRALVGKSPKWFFSINGDRAKGLEDAEKQMQQLIQRWKQLASGMDNQLSSPISEAVKNCLVHERGYLRIWTPLRFVNSDDPVMRVALHSPPPSSVEIDRDRDGFIEEIRYTYRDGEDSFVEVQRIDPDTNETIIAYRGIGGESIAVPGFDDETEEIRLNLGGRYTVYEMRRESMITASAKQAQDAINFQLTLLLRNSSFGGFLREIIMNAQPPGKWEKDTDGQDKFVPDLSGFQSGPGSLTFLTGVPNYNELGQITGYTSPSVDKRDPISPETFLNAARAFIAIIYEEMGQAHLLAAEQGLSGVSRIQLRQDFETALQEDSDVIEAALSGIYASAFLMMNQEQAERYAGLDVPVQLQLSVSKPTPEELQENRESFKAGLKSLSTAMADAGIEDVDAEMALIDEERQQQQASQPITLNQILGVPTNGSDGNATDNPSTV